MSDYEKWDKSLNEYLRLNTFPLAIKMVKSLMELPQDYEKMQGRLGKIPLCQAITLSRRYGWKVLLGKEDMHCPAAGLSLGFWPHKETCLDGSHLVPLWCANQDARKTIFQNMPKFEHGSYDYVAISPLAKVDFEPQMVLLFGDPARMMRLIQASVYQTGETFMSGAVGATGCATYVTKTILEKKNQMVMLGGGDRIFAQAHDDEVAFSIPIEKMEDTLAGLEYSNSCGMRYPVVNYMLYEPALPKTYAGMMKDLTS